MSFERIDNAIRIAENVFSLEADRDTLNAWFVQVIRYASLRRPHIHANLQQRVRSLRMGSTASTDILLRANVGTCIRSNAIVLLTTPLIHQ
jgi:hypothetical protein